MRAPKRKPVTRRASKAARQSRPSHEVRTLILRAARELFSTKGYEATTTKDIAQKAAVLEPLLFTNFGSKTGIFEAAVIAPFAELATDYVDSWNRRYADSTPTARISGFIENFYDLATRHRKLLLSVFMQSESGSQSCRDLLMHLADAMIPIATSIDAVQREYPEIDPPAEFATIAGMVFGVALLDAMLFPSGSARPGQARLVAAMANTVTAGIVHQHEAAKNKSTTRRRDAR